MTNPHEELQRELGAPSALVHDLEHHHAADLLDLFRTAMKHESVALHHAVDETINGLPRLFRGTARKIVFPGGK